MEYLIGIWNTCGERYVSGCSPNTECLCHGVCAREVPAHPALGWGHRSPLPAAFHFFPLAFCAWLFAFEVYTEAACFKAFPQKVLSCLTGVSLWITSSVFKKLPGTGALGKHLRGWGCPLGSWSFPADTGLLEVGGLYVLSDFCSPFIHSDNRIFAAFSERWFCSLAVSSTLSLVSCLVWFCFSQCSSLVPFATLGCISDFLESLCSAMGWELPKELVLFLLLSWERWWEAGSDANRVLSVPAHTEGQQSPCAPVPGCRSPGGCACRERLALPDLPASSPGSLPLFSV